jgi:hypothetical protein
VVAVAVSEKFTASTALALLVEPPLFVTTTE